MDSIPFHRLACSCGHSACRNRHAYYYRSIKTPSGKIRLRICRVKCSFCDTTHALLLAEMIPYSQIPLISQIYIARESLSSSPDYSAVMDKNPEIDESNIASVLRQFNPVSGKNAFCHSPFSLQNIIISSDSLLPSSEDSLCRLNVPQIFFFL